AMDLGLLHVHIDAKAAAVHLRGADLDQVQDRRLDRPGFEQHAELGELLEQIGGLGGCVQALSHDGSLGWLAPPARVAGALSWLGQRTNRRSGPANPVDAAKGPRCCLKGTNQWPSAPAA